MPLWLATARRTLVARWRCPLTCCKCKGGVGRRVRASRGQLSGRMPACLAPARRASSEDTVMDATVFELVGREGELAMASSLLDDLSAGARALVLEGEAGIG